MTALEFIETNIDLIQQGTPQSFQKLLDVCPQYIVKDVFNMFDIAQVKYPKSLLIKGIRPSATTEEKDIYNVALSKGVQPNYFRSYEWGVSLTNNTLDVNIERINDVTFKVWIRHSDDQSVASNTFFLANKSTLEKFFEGLANDTFDLSTANKHEDLRYGLKGTYNS